MNEWPNGYRHSMLQSEHREWNATHYPGTRQLCEECGAETGRCEDDSLFADEDGEIGPLCEECWENLRQDIVEGGDNMLDESCDMVAGHQCPYDEDATCVDAPNAPEDCWEDRDTQDKRCETYTVYQQKERIRILETMTKKITHCHDCGSTWYDDGFTAECPQCRVRRLEAELEEWQGKTMVARMESAGLEVAFDEEREARADLVRKVEGVVEDMHFVSRWAIKEKLRDIVKEGGEKMRKEYRCDWMDEARQIAAQCWCDPETENTEMDVVLGEAVAKRVAFWMETAAQNERNADYYRGLLEECGDAIGHEAFVQDDGGIVEDVLCAKVPELVRGLTRTRAALEELMREVRAVVERLHYNDTERRVEDITLYSKVALRAALDRAERVEKGEG